MSNLGQSGSIKIFEKMNLVVLLHSGRCGSTVLGEILKKRGDFTWAGEILEDNEWMRSINGKRILSHLAEQILSCNKNNFGFEIKFMPFQHLRKELLNMSIPELLVSLKKININKFIVLKRENHLKRLVSQYVAGKTDLWHTTNEVKTITTVAIDISNVWIGDTKMALLEYLESMEDGYERLYGLLAPEDILCLSYEKDIEIDPSRAHRKIAEYLDIPYKTVFAGLKKTNPFQLKDVIENHRKIRDSLKNTRFAWMAE